MIHRISDKILESRRELVGDWSPQGLLSVDEEGGCGVTGFVSSIPVGGRHIYEPSVQMHNRGNGKGGGIAAVGLDPDQLGVSREILSQDYLLQIALLDPDCRENLEAEFIDSVFDVHSRAEFKPVCDWREIPELEVRPPDVWRYFVRVKPEILNSFAAEKGLQGAPSREIEDEFIYQNSYRLNAKYYASLGDKAAFVLSHARDMAIFKMVAYAEQNVKYYGLEDFRAHVWIAHQRYPTKGRVWHPGGAHPFCGMNEALVHNGDFANYYSVCEYLLQRNIKPQFLTDTEVSVLVFDLWNRVYKYPLEYIIEGLAPTTERDFDRLPQEKQEIYRQIQSAHIHASPDGPWFFIIARSNPDEQEYQLLGITDTAMLRPQVFAMLDSEDVQVGFLCSEKQAIDATLKSLASEDPRFCRVADKYWNARGGSHTDGGAFMFTIKGNGKKNLICTDKFGKEVKLPAGQKHADLTVEVTTPQSSDIQSKLDALIKAQDALALADWVKASLTSWSWNDLRWVCRELASRASETDATRATAIEALTLLRDNRYSTGDKKRSSVLDIIDRTLENIFGAVSRIDEPLPAVSKYVKVDWSTKDKLRAPDGPEEVMVVDTLGFPPEGDDCDARTVVEAYHLGWKRFISYGYVGQRFLGCGLGADTQGVRIDAYGSSGDYLASGMDGLEIRVHDNAQDQLGQIAKAGKLVIYGDVGQTFMYGAKGGEVYVLGNAAGRPLINAVGRPKVVINGTCLDFLAESFMAGDPLQGGGFVILNGITFDHEGNIVELDTPYPGSNLFSLASGGAIFVRDPHKLLTDDQLNGAEYRELSDAEWKLMLTFLEENERLFGVPIERLLTVDGERKSPREVYRKVVAVKAAAVPNINSETEDD
jgi:glutamate synthase domain-containing protein 1/glutamate synthase domain-containing protein 3